MIFCIPAQKIENVVVGFVLDFISRSTMDQKLGLNYSHEWCIQRRIIQKDVIQYSSRTFIQEMRESAGFNVKSAQDGATFVMVVNKMANIWNIGTLALALLPRLLQQSSPRPRSTPTILIDFILLISISPISILPTNQHGESAFSNQHYTHHNQQISESANQHFTRVQKLMHTVKW